MQTVQLDMFISELRELEKHQKEEKDRKANKKIRAMFHILSDMAKEQLIEKNP
jgi:hypothetical protein